MKKLKLINMKQVRALHPCSERLANAAKYYSQKSYTYAQMLGLKNITHTDKVWLAFKLMPKTNIALASADIAELVLPLYEVKHPLDKRPRLAIEAARSGNANAAYDAYAACQASARAASAGRNAARAAIRASAAYAIYTAAADVTGVRATDAYKASIETGGCASLAAITAGAAASTDSRAAASDDYRSTYAHAAGCSAAGAAADAAEYDAAYASSDAYTSDAAAYAGHAAKAKIEKKIRTILLKYLKG